MAMSFPRSVRAAGSIAALILGSIPLLAAQGDGVEGYSVTNLMIPMRDGVRLNTKVFTPLRTGGPWPFLMMRTPYGIAESNKRFVTALKN